MESLDYLSTKKNNNQKKHCSWNLVTSEATAQRPECNILGSSLWWPLVVGSQNACGTVPKTFRFSRRMCKRTFWSRQTSVQPKSAKTRWFRRTNKKHFVFPDGLRPHPPTPTPSASAAPPPSPPPPHSCATQHIFRQIPNVRTFYSAAAQVNFWERRRIFPAREKEKREERRGRKKERNNMHRESPKVYEPHPHSPSRPSQLDSALIWHNTCATLSGAAN